MSKNSQSLINEIREKYPARHALFLLLEDCVLEILCNTRELKNELAGYFKTFLSKPQEADISISIHQAPLPNLDFNFQSLKPEPGKKKLKEEYCDLPEGRIVRKILSGMVFIFGKGQNQALGPCEQNPNQVINFINNRFIEWKLCQGALLGHAAGVLWDGRGLALAGFSGMGKSTLALHLVSREATFVSNDRLLVSKEGAGLHMTGVAKLPRINPGTALNNPHLANIIPAEDKKRILQLPPEQLWDLEQKYDVDIESCFGGNRFILSGPMQGLIILNWKRNSEPVRIKQVDPRKRSDLLYAFIKSAGVFFYPEDKCEYMNPSIKDYVSVLSNCSLLEISGGIDFDRAADICMNFLQNNSQTRREYDTLDNAQLSSNLN